MSFCSRSMLVTIIWIICSIAIPRPAAGQPPAGRRNACASHQAGIAEKPDDLARVDLRNLFDEFDQPVGVDQRGQ
jgi:hypothetical protein